MKKTFMLLAILSLCQVFAFGQKKYEMVIEKTDGSEIAVNVEDIVRTYFRERTDGTLTLSSNSVELKVAETKFIEILSGSGWYNTNTSNPNIVTVASNGSVISLTGKGAGTAEVTVFDAQYQVTKKISVTVTASEQPVVPLLSCPDGNHPHMIDLGLPSGTKWACCNVGASKPEGYGNYYAWGETKPKSVYNWSTYIHCNGSISTCHDIGSNIAGTSYDAATVNWGAPWQMPSREQYNELKNGCNSIWTTENGTSGRKFTGPNGGTIFIPAAGNRWNDKLYNAGTNGLYWSSTLITSFPYHVWYLGFYSEDVSAIYDNRDIGLSIRPVRK